MQENHALGLSCLADIGKCRHIYKNGLVQLVADRFKGGRHRVFMVKEPDSPFLAHANFTAHHNSTLREFIRKDLVNPRLNHKIRSRLETDNHDFLFAAARIQGGQKILRRRNFYAVKATNKFQRALRQIGILGISLQKYSLVVDFAPLGNHDDVGTQARRKAIQAL